MKLKTIASAVLLSSVLGLTLAGCQSSPTQESTGQYVDSSATTTKVKAALLSTKGIDSTNISVTTYKGVVQLSGFVNSEAQKQLADQVSSNVTGVQSVENDLIVKPNP